MLMNRIEMMPRDAPLVYDSADAAGSTVYSYRVTSIARHYRSEARHLFASRNGRRSSERALVWWHKSPDRFLVFSGYLVSTRRCRLRRHRAITEPHRRYQTPRLYGFLWYVTCGGRGDGGRTSGNIRQWGDEGSRGVYIHTRVRRKNGE